jgi:cellobiose-specific phosphotransferase system component IIA
MNTERWRDRVRNARRELDEARRWQQQVDDDAAEQRVKDAKDNLRRAALNQPPIPESVREAMRRFDEYTEDHDEELRAGNPEVEAKHLELMAAATDAECAAGVHTHCRHAGLGGRKRTATPLDDVDAAPTNAWEERQQRWWGVINPDGTVTRKGRMGDDDADADQEVHPPGSLAWFIPGEGWFNMATGHPASDGPATPVARPAVTKTVEPPRPATTTSPGGTGMSIQDAREGIMSGLRETGEGALRAIGQAHEMVGDARNDMLQATEGSNQAEAEPARARLADAMEKLEEAKQQVAQALQEFEEIANRL